MVVEVLVLLQHLILDQMVDQVVVEQDLIILEEVLLQLDLG
jgi:hypothetical protein